MCVCSSRAGEADGPVGCGALSRTSSPLPPHAASYEAVSQAKAALVGNQAEAVWVAALPAVVVVVMLVYDMGTPISGTAVAQNRGAALPSSSLHEH